MEFFSPVEYEIFLLSLRVAFWGVICSLPFAILIALLLARYSFPGKFILNTIVHLPLVVPPVVIGYLLLSVFGNNGVLGRWLFEVFQISIAFTWKGAALAASVMAFPLMVRAIRLSLDLLDVELEEAAETLGAGPFKKFISVTLPLILPGIIVGTLLGFARSLGEFGATITFVSNIPGETQTLPLAMFKYIQTPGGDFQALRLMTLSVILAVGALIISELVERKLKVRSH
jgi:molybdate transport system permease protein